MDETKTVAILSALANGVNPSTGEVFGPDSPYQQADIVRALFAALERFKQVDKPQPKSTTKPGAGAPSNVGKPWTEQDDRRLLAEFDRGRNATELARDLGRTLAGIEARLERHGRMSARDRTTANRFTREKGSPAQTNTG